MTLRTSPSLRRLIHAGGLGAAAAMAAGAMVLTAPAGNAIPESTIISECDAAGGTYQSTVADGKRYSQCCYRDSAGKKHCDNYVDGNFTNTVDYAVVEGAPTPSPSSRPGAEAGLPATEVAPAPSGPPQFGTATLYLPPPPEPAGPRDAAPAP